VKAEHECPLIDGLKVKGARDRRRNGRRPSRQARQGKTWEWSEGRGDPDMRAPVGSDRKKKKKGRGRCWAAGWTLGYEVKRKGHRPA
jgi:hypothetical protein